jgi:hypothetical protein
MPDEIESGDGHTIGGTGVEDRLPLALGNFPPLLPIANLLFVRVAERGGERATAVWAGVTRPQIDDARSLSLFGHFDRLAPSTPGSAPALGYSGKPDRVNHFWKYFSKPT